jgi:hypothetical protein
MADKAKRGQEGRILQQMAAVGGFCALWLGWDWNIVMLYIGPEYQV